MSMVKLEARKENGGIWISEGSFEHLLNCLANQQFVGERPPCGDAVAMSPEEYATIHQEMQDVIDDFYRQCMGFFHGKK